MHYKPAAHIQYSSNSKLNKAFKDKKRFINKSRELLSRNQNQFERKYIGQVANINLDASSSDSNPSFTAAKESMHNLIQKCTASQSMTKEKYQSDFAFHSMDNGVSIDYVEHRPANLVMGKKYSDSKVAGVKKTKENNKLAQ